MRILFSDTPPVFDGSALCVRFLASVDGADVDCAITAEALEDHFGAPSALEADLIAAFERGLPRIRAVCADALKLSGGGSVVLRSGLFRVEDAR